MTDLISSQAVGALIQVVLIDLVLAGDNALVIGLAAAGLPPERRRRAIAVGILSATALRILCAGLATQLLQLFGLALAGGILLLWVCWKLWREISAASQHQDRGDERLVDHALERNRTIAGKPHRKAFGQVVLRIVVADVSMSVDNVFAIAGAARGHPFALAFGLVLSVALMGVAAELVSRLLQKHRWLAYLGLASIFYVACDMIYRGAYELKPLIGAVKVFSE
jgi:YjbE family integral membrane protein